MGMSYKKLWKLLIDKNMNKGDLQRLAGVSTSSIAKLSKGVNVQTDVLSRICYFLDCDISDIAEYERDSTDLDRLRVRKRQQIENNSHR